MSRSHTAHCERAASMAAPCARQRAHTHAGAQYPKHVICLGVLKQVEDGACVPGLTIRPFASTADVEALMCSASAQQNAASSHLVLSSLCSLQGPHTTGAQQRPKHSVDMVVPCCESLQSFTGVDCQPCA